MIFGKIKKFLNIISKLCLWVWIALKSHIMIITLIIGFLECVVIMYPSPIIKPSAMPRDKMAVSLNSTLQFREYGAEHWVNSQKALRPVGSLRIEALKFFQKTLPEKLSGFGTLAASIIAYFQPIFYEVPQKTYQGNEQSNTCNGYWGFYAWLPLLFFWPWESCSLRKRKHHSTK